MAHLQKKKDIWYLVDKSAGKAQWIKLGPIKQHEAKAVLSRYEIDQTYLKIDLLPNDPIKFKDLTTQYTKYAKTIKGADTVKNEEDLLNKLGDSIGERQIRSLNLEDLQTLLTGKPNYIRLKIAVLRSVYKFAIDRRILKKNLALELKRPRIPVLPPKHSDPVTIQKIFDAMVPETRFKFVILLYTGMRPSEMCRLQVQDINFKTQNLTVRYAKPGRFRIIPIHQDLIPIFEEIIKGKSKEDYLFIGKNGVHLKSSSVRSALLRACHKIKIKGVTPYTFRHHFGTMILEKTQNLRLAQQLLGHSDIQMTTRYATALDHRLRDAVDML